MNLVEVQSANTDPTGRPAQKSARPRHNRAMLYLLLETGMRRAAVVNLNLNDIAWENYLVITTEEESLWGLGLSVFRAGVGDPLPYSHSSIV